MGCICNLSVREENIPPWIVGPMLWLAGAMGLFVDYLNIGVHSAWWYGAAIGVGIVINVLGVRRKRKKEAAAAAQSHAAPTEGS